MDIQNALQMALRHYRDGHLDRVERICRKILRARPDQPDALHLRGIVALGAGKHAQAIRRIKKAIEGSPKNPSYHVSLGDCFKGLDRFDEAVSAYEHSLKINPQWAQAHCSLGTALQAQGKTDDALRCYERALEIDPAFAQAHFNIGAVLSTRGELTAAARAYERAISHAPRFADGFVKLGDALRRLERLEEAETAYLRAAELDPSIAAAHRGLGIVDRLQGRLGDALKRTNRALELEPDVSAAHAELGHVLLLLGNIDDSIMAFRHAVTLDPASAWAQMGLSAALAKADRVADARAATAKALGLKRTRILPCLGREPVGRVVILKGAENESFRMNEHGDLTILAGANNADDHFDRTKFSLCSYFLDGLEPGRELDDLPDCELIFNGIGDADFVPQCHHRARAIADAVSIPVINHPREIEKTRRHRMFQSMSGIDGIVFPKTIHLTRPLQSRKELEELLGDAEIDFPTVARCVGTHQAMTLEKAQTFDELWAYLSADTEKSHYIAEFIDAASPRGVYIKMRFFVVGGQPFPSHMYIWNDWCVSTAIQVKELMWANDWMIEEAKRLLGDPKAYLGQDRFRALAAACARVPLEYFGIDFACHPDGGLLVFEANPAMRLPPISNDPFPFRKPYTEAIQDAMQRLLEKKITEGKARRATVVTTP